LAPTDQEVIGFDWSAVNSPVILLIAGLAGVDNPAEVVREECRQAAENYYTAVSLSPTQETYPDIIIKCQKLTFADAVRVCSLENNNIPQGIPAPNCGIWLIPGGGNVLGDGITGDVFFRFGDAEGRATDFDETSEIVFGKDVSVGEICGIAEAVTDPANSGTVTIPGSCCIDAPVAPLEKNWGSKVRQLLRSTPMLCQLMLLLLRFLSNLSD
jgi:hypothetical protein